MKAVSISFIDVSASVEVKRKGSASAFNVEGWLCSLTSRFTVPVVSVSVLVGRNGGARGLRPSCLSGLEVLLHGW